MTLSAWIVIYMKEQHYDNFRYLFNHDCGDCPRRDGCRRNISRRSPPPLGWPRSARTPQALSQSTLLG